MHIHDANNNRIESQDTLQMLGFVFNSNGDVSDQLELLKAKFRVRIWKLRELKRHDFTEKELLKVYTTMIRPVIEYSSVIHHSMLISEQCCDLEKLQARALKKIFGYIYSYRKLLEMSNLETLEERRVQACLKFATKTCSNPRFASWFPKK